MDGLGLLEQGIIGPRVSGKPHAPLEVVATAMAEIPNADVHWDEWNRIGMAAWRATGGAPEGLEAWSAWSAKSAKHDGEACTNRWRNFAVSPPSRIGAGTLFHLARQATGWTRTREELQPRDGVPEKDPGQEERSRKRSEPKARKTKLATNPRDSTILTVT